MLITSHMIVKNIHNWSHLKVQYLSNLNVKFDKYRYTVVTCPDC